MRRVILESPYKGKSLEECLRNVAYACAAAKHALALGEAPFASHLLYTQMLDDSVPAERALGITAGLAWGHVADATVVYTDLGVSTGMIYGIENAKHAGRPVEYRQLGQGWEEAES